MPGCNILLRFPALPLFLFNRELLMLSRSSYHARPTVKYVVLTICKHKAFFSTWYDLHKEHNCCFVAYLIMTEKAYVFMPQKSIFLVIKWGTVCFGFLFSNAFTSRKINTRTTAAAAVRQVVKLVERASKRHKGWDPTTTATSTNASATLF